MNKKIKIAVASVLAFLGIGGASLGWGYYNPTSSNPVNLTTSNFATTSISQWNNDAGYVTSTSGGAETDPIFMAASTSLGYAQSFSQTVDIYNTTGTYVMVPAVEGMMFIPTQISLMYTTSTDAGSHGSLNTQLFIGTDDCFYLSSAATAVGEPNLQTLDFSGCVITPNTAWNIVVNTAESVTSSLNFLVIGNYVNE